MNNISNKDPDPVFLGHPNSDPNFKTGSADPKKCSGSATLVLITSFFREYKMMETKQEPDCELLPQFSSAVIQQVTEANR